MINFLYKCIIACTLCALFILGAALQSGAEFIHAQALNQARVEMLVGLPLEMLTRIPVDI